MATAPRLEPDAVVVEDYLAAMRAADRRTGRSTTRAARSCQAKIRRAGGWGRLNRAEQLDAVVKAPSFASWLMVTGRITVDAELLSATDLRLGNAARLYCANDHRWQQSHWLRPGAVFDRARLLQSWGGGCIAVLGLCHEWSPRSSLRVAESHPGPSMRLIAITVLQTRL